MPCSRHVPVTHICCKTTANLSSTIFTKFKGASELDYTLRTSLSQQIKPTGTLFMSLRLWKRVCGHKWPWPVCCPYTRVVHVPAQTNWDSQEIAIRCMSIPRVLIILTCMLPILYMSVGNAPSAIHEGLHRLKAPDPSQWKRCMVLLLVDFSLSVLSRAAVGCVARCSCSQDEALIPRPFRSVFGLKTVRPACSDCDTLRVFPELGDLSCCTVPLALAMVAVRWLLRFCIMCCWAVLAGTCPEPATM